jgi:selenocysteine lyase/cysteine desulfurase
VTLDLQTIRSLYPQVEECVYLNSNSTGLFPRETEDVLRAYWRTLRRWRDAAWEGWWADLHAYADELARFIGADAGSVWTDCSLSSLLGRLGTALDFEPPRNRIVITDAEFPTIEFLWRGFRRRGAEVVVARAAQDGGVDDAAVERLIDERTRLVCVSHATFDTGALFDVRRLAKRAHEAGALIAVDAYQSVGAVPIDVRALDVDVLLGGAHKWLCGSTESAFIHVRPQLLAELEPAATGWVAAENPLSFSRAVRHCDGARRFATGTPQILPCQISRVSLRIIDSIGIGTVRKQSIARTQRIIERADEAGLPVATPREPSRRGGVVALRFDGAADVTAELVSRGYICSFRGVLRIAPHFYNTDDEVDSFMDALIDAARRRRR